jgi:hypothetical protein
MLTLYRSLVGDARGSSGVQRFRTPQEANAKQHDPYRR